MKNYYYAFTIRNLKSQDPTPCQLFLTKMKQVFPTVEIDYHWEVVPKGKRKFHNVHLHGMVKSPKSIYAKRHIDCPYGLHFYWSQVQNKQAYHIYRTKDKLNTIEDCQRFIDYLDNERPDEQVFLDNGIDSPDLDSIDPSEPVTILKYNIFNRMNQCEAKI